MGEEINRCRGIAIIVPVFNEGENLFSLYGEIKNVIDSLPDYSFEILFVDDGSKDDSWNHIKKLARKDPIVGGLTLSRNFGKEMALTAGVEALGSAAAVICIDADLQHPPELIPEFIAKWESGSEIVVGIRKDVADYSLLKNIGSKLFYALMTRFSDVDIPPNSTDFRLLDKKVVKTLCTFSERTRMFRGLIDWLGYRKDFIEFHAPARHNGGQPSYTLRKLLDLAINSLTSFSLLPLRVTGYLGLLVTSMAAFLLVFMLGTDFFNIMVYTLLAYFVVFNTFLVGVMLSAIGMIALYIGHIHTEVVGRPLYVVRDQVGLGGRDYL